MSYFFAFLIKRTIIRRIETIGIFLILLYNVFGKIGIVGWSEIIDFETNRQIFRKQAKTK